MARKQKHTAAPAAAPIPAPHAHFKIKWWMIALLVMVTYVRVMTNGFISDDVQLITERQQFFGSTAGLSELLTHGYWHGSPQAETRALYRPWISATYWIEAQLSGNSPALYHLSNVLIHAANAALIIPVFTPLLGPAAAVFLAALFGVTPAALISVGWIAGRTDVWLLFFALLFFLSLRRALLSHKSLHIVTAAISYFMAVMSKESGLVLPVFAALLLWVERGKNSEHTPRWNWKVFAAILGTAILTLVIRNKAIGSAVFAAGGVQALDHTLPALAEQLLRHLGQALLPLHSQMFSGLWPQESAAETVRFYVLWILFLTIAVASVWGIARKKIWAAGLLWAGVVLLPIYALGQAWQPVTYFYNYFALPGFHLAAISIIIIVRSRRTWREKLTDAIVQKLAIAVVLIFALTTFLRTPLLANATTLYTYMEQRDPKNIEVLLGLGGYLLAEGKSNEGLAMFERAAAADSTHPDPYRRLLDWHLSNNDLRSASRIVPAVTRVGLGDPASLAMLGRYYYESGACSTAAQYYQKSFALQPPTSPTTYDYGLVLLCLGQYLEGRDLYLSLVQKHPTWAYAYNNLGMCFESLGEYEAAAKAYQATVRNDPKLATPFVSLALCYQRIGKKNEAAQAAAEFTKRAAPSAQTERLKRQLSDAGIAVQN